MSEKDLTPIKGFMEDIIAISKFLQSPQPSHTVKEDISPEKTINKVSFRKPSAVNQKIFEKIQSRIYSHLNCLLGMVESHQRNAERPSTAD